MLRARARLLSVADGEARQRRLLCAEKRIYIVVREKVAAAAAASFLISFGNV